jgi:sialidase-1
LLLVWNNNHLASANHGGKRTPLTAAISSDEGKTWKNLCNLEDKAEQAYAYTSITFFRDRALLTYYVGEGGRISSRFRSLPVNWFYAGTP